MGPVVAMKGRDVMKNPTRVSTQAATEERQRRTKIRTALKAMGYSEQKAGRWLKPIGYQLFEYNEETNTWTNWFKGGPAAPDGELMVWETKKLDDDVQRHGSYLHQLKFFECYTRTGIAVDGITSEFELPVIVFEELL